MNRGERSSGWTWREWDHWFRQNETLVRDYFPTECGMNVATMSYYDKFQAAFNIAFNKNLFAGAAYQLMAGLKAEDAVIFAGVLGALASLGTAAAAAGGTAVTFGPAGAIAALVVGLMAGDLLLTARRVDIAIQNADNCYDLEEAAPVIAEMMVKLAAAGLLDMIIKLVKGTFKPSPKTPPSGGSTGNSTPCKPPPQAKPNTSPVQENCPATRPANQGSTKPKCEIKIEESLDIQDARANEATPGSNVTIDAFTNQGATRIPQGLTEAQFNEVAAAIRTKTSAIAQEFRIPAGAGIMSPKEI